MQEFFASAIPGTEKALCDELRELGFSSVRLNRGGIPFRGEWADGWRACLVSRIAQRIQVLLGRFPVKDQESLYAGIQAIDWTPYLSYRQTLAIKAAGTTETLNHTGFVALKVKDAIVDQIRQRQGKRPSIDPENADVRVFVYLARDRAAVYLDLSGEPLHLRGYRKSTGEAPIRETLAAALLRMSEWDRKTPLLDPMCGSGTIAIEAALWAMNKAPGLERERFGFERWANFCEADTIVMREMRGRFRGEIRSPDVKIFASDVDKDVLTKAHDNARLAGIKLSIREASITTIQRDRETCMVVMNPPYGVRLDASPELVRTVATAVSRWHGWQVGILVGSPEYERLISISPVARVELQNGPIDCDFLLYDVP